jgi:segregation and condensation protein A
LLLHLARSSQVDLAEVPLAEITEQFLAYLRALEEISLEVSGEFLVTVAALSYLKSKALLPPEPESEEEAALEEDPAVELQRRLVEYHVYKAAAGRLEAAKQARERVFLRPLAEPTEVEAGFVSLTDVSLFDMVGAVHDLLKRAAPEPVGRVHLPPLTVPDRIEELLLRLETEGAEMRFSDLVPQPPTRTQIIITFLAMLELMRRGQAEARQEAPGGEILLRLIGINPTLTPA